MHPRRSNLALRGGGFRLAKPGTLKAAAKTQVPDWYNGAGANGGQLASLLVCKTCLRSRNSAAVAIWPPLAAASL